LVAVRLLFVHEFRPRPAIWRLVLVGTCQVLIAAWVVNAAVSAVELLIVRDAGLSAWIVYGSPWDSLRERLEPDPADAELVSRVAEADRIHLHVAGWFAAGAVVLALLLVKLWPAGPALAARTFGYVLGAVLSTFGVARLASHPVRFDLPPAAILGSLSIVAGAGVAILALRRVIVLLGNVYERRPRWFMFLAIVPPCALVAVRAPFYAALLAGCAAIAACFPAPAKFEQLTRVEFREAVVPLLIATALLCLATTRALVVRERVFRVEQWEAIRLGIPQDWPMSTAEHAPHPRRPPRVHPRR
jgi:hypothetical protein